MVSTESGQQGATESGESGQDLRTVQGLAGRSEGSGFYSNIRGKPLKASLDLLCACKRLPCVLREEGTA